MPAHPVEALLLRAAEQLTLGRGAFDTESARRHEGFAADGPVCQKEDRCLRHIALGRHFAEIKLRQHAAANLFSFGGDAIDREEGGVDGRHFEQPIGIGLHRVGTVRPARRIEEIAAIA